MGTKLSNRQNPVSQSGAPDIKHYNGHRPDHGVVYTAFSERIGGLAWDNNLSLNAENIKEINIDPRRRKQQHVSIGIGETEMYEGETLSISRRRISQHPAAPEEVTAEDGLFLRRLRKFGMLTNIFSNTSTVKSCSFQRVIKNAQRISGGGPRCNKRQVAPTTQSLHTDTTV